MKTDLPNRVFITALIASVLCAVVFSLYKYWYTENFFFQIEAACTTDITQCFTRSCDEGDCPPNDLETYNMYRLPAKEFAQCEDNGCANLCGAGKSPSCALIPCTDDGESSCGTKETETSTETEQSIESS